MKKKTLTPPVQSRNISLWQLGNTGFRSPERLLTFMRLINHLKEPLWRVGLAKRQFSKDASMMIAHVCAQTHAKDPFGAKSLMKIKSDPETQSLDGIGKALKALSDLGMLRSPQDASGLTGKDLFTDHGQRFLSARTSRARRILFAQTMSATQVSSRGISGRPLQLIAQILLELKAVGESPCISISDLAWCLMPSSLDIPASQVVKDILQHRETEKRYRADKESLEGRRQREMVAIATRSLPKRNTLLDYADVTARYLLFTGLFSSSSHSHLKMDPIQEPIWQALANGMVDPWSSPAVAATMRTRLESLLGEPLPKKMCPIITGLSRLDKRATTHHMTDETVDAKIKAILTEGYLGRTIAWDGSDFPVGDLKVSAPAVEWALAAFISRILARSGEIIRGEGWRGRADVAGRPERCAPGGGPDAVLESPLHQFNLEGTLLTHSRQEACEGESVRRHVAMAGLQTHKDVWGIFSAPSVDYNTHLAFMAGGHFDSGVWVESRVIPLSFEQIVRLHQAELTLEGLVGLCQSCWDQRPMGLPIKEQPKAWGDILEAEVTRYELDSQLQLK